MGYRMPELYCLKYAESVLPEALVFENGASGATVPITFTFYLIRTKDKNILVDVGCEKMPDFDMKKFFSPAFVLRKFDLTASDITDVIITHAHHDHIGAIKHFSNALVHITEIEYNQQGKQYIPADMRVNVFNKEYSISPEIKAIEWGGHTAGSAIVEIKSGGDIYVLAGDECYVGDCITRKIPTGSSCNKEKSREFIEKYGNGAYRVCTSHDISLKTERII